MKHVFQTVVAVAVVISCCFADTFGQDSGIGLGARTGSVPILAHVAGNAALGKIPVAVGRVRRDGFAATGDGGAADYTLRLGPCPTYDGGGDGGSQIAVIGGCAMLDPGTASVTPQVFGARGDSNGTAGNGTDDTTAILAWASYSYALDGLVGRRIRLPALPQGRVYRVTRPIVLYATAFIQGDGCTPSIDVSSWRPGGGSILFLDHLGKGIQTVGGETVLDSICTYRAQPAPSSANDNSFTPGDFDFDIYTDADTDLRNIVTINPTNGVYGHTGRLWIDGWKGRPLTIGLKTYGILDTVKWRGIHFWPYSAGNATSVYNWQYNHLTAFDLARSDNSEMSDVSSIVQKTCFKFSANPASASPFQGAANKFRAVNVDCDGIGNGAGIYVDASVGPSSGVLTASFTNFTTQSSNAPNNSPFSSAGLNIVGSGSTIQFNGYQSTFMACSALNLGGMGNIVRLQGAFLQNWGMQSNACDAVQVATGNSLLYTDVPIFDYAQNTAAALHLYGGSRYGLAAHGIDSFPPGFGKLSLLDLTNGNSAEILIAGGTQIITQSGSSLVNAGRSTDTGCKANTPAGKVGICYSVNRAMYVIYNNTSAQLKYWFNQSAPRPMN